MISPSKSSGSFVRRGFFSLSAPFLLACLPLVVVAQTAPVERPPTQDLLPETTVAFIQIDNIRDLVTKLKEGSMGQMLADESVAPLVEGLWGEAKSAYADVEDNVGISLDDIQAFPAGELTFAVIAPRRKDPEFMLIIQTDPESEAVDRIMERGREVIRDEAGQEIESEESEDGIEFESFTVEGRKIKFFRKDGLLVGGTSEDELNSFIDRWMGREVEKVRSLSQNRKFITIMNRCLGTKEVKPEARFFVDPIALAKSATRGNAGAQIAINFLPVFGLDGLLGIGGSMLLSEDEFNSVVHGHMLLAEPRKGLFEMLAFRPTNYEPEPWIPNDVSNYSTTSWDIDQLLVELTKIIETFQSEGAVEKFFVDTADKELGFDVREELLGNLTGRVTFAQWFEPEIRVNSQVPLISLEVKDPEAMEATLEKIVARINRDLPEDNERRWFSNDYKGVQIFGPSEESTKILGERRLERQRERNKERGRESSFEVNPRADSPAIALVGNYLLLSVIPPQSRTFLQRAIETDQGDSESLAASENYHRVAAKMTRLLKTDMPSAITYADPRTTIRWMMELAKAQDTQTFLAERAVDNKYVGGLKNVLDENPLPEFSELEHYFQPQGGFMTSDETGLHFLIFEMKAEK